MLTLSYESKDFFDDTWAAAQRRESFEIVVKGFRAWLIKKAKPLVPLFIENSQQPIREKRLTILRLFFEWGLATPSFWALYVYAIGYEMQARWELHDGMVRVVFEERNEGDQGQQKSERCQDHCLDGLGARVWAVRIAPGVVRNLISTKS
ncbi:MAG: hypothetical protein ACXW37_07570 [Nitrospira sp.]